MEGIQSEVTAYITVRGRNLISRLFHFLFALLRRPRFMPDGNGSPQHANIEILGITVQREPVDENENTLFYMFIMRLPGDEAQFYIRCVHNVTRMSTDSMQLQYRMYCDFDEREICQPYIDVQWRERYFSAATSYSVEVTDDLGEFSNINLITSSQICRRPRIQIMELVPCEPILVRVRATNIKTDPRNRVVLRVGTRHYMTSRNRNANLSASSRYPSCRCKHSDVPRNRRGFRQANYNLESEWLLSSRPKHRAIPRPRAKPRHRRVILMPNSRGAWLPAPYLVREALGMVPFVPSLWPNQEAPEFLVNPFSSLNVSPTPSRNLSPTQFLKLPPIRSLTSSSSSTLLPPSTKSLRDVSGISSLSHSIESSLSTLLSQSQIQSPNSPQIQPSDPDPEATPASSSSSSIEGGGPYVRPVFRFRDLVNSRPRDSGPSSSSGHDPELSGDRSPSNENVSPHYSDSGYNTGSIPFLGALFRYILDLQDRHHSSDSASPTSPVTNSEDINNINKPYLPERCDQEQDETDSMPNSLELTTRRRLPATPDVPVHSRRGTNVIDEEVMPNSLELTTRRRLPTTPDVPVHSRRGTNFVDDGAMPGCSRWPDKTRRKLPAIPNNISVYRRRDTIHIENELKPSCSGLATHRKLPGIPNVPVHRMRGYELSSSSDDSG